MILRTMAATMTMLILTVTMTPLRAAEETIEVWKSPTCGCCSGWVDHLRENGFEVVTNDVDDLGAIKRMAGVPGRRTVQLLLAHR